MVKISGFYGWLESQFWAGFAFQIFAFEQKTNLKNRQAAAANWQVRGKNPTAPEKFWQKNGAMFAVPSSAPTFDTSFNKKITENMLNAFFKKGNESAAAATQPRPTIFSQFDQFKLENSSLETSEMLEVKGGQVKTFTKVYAWNTSFGELVKQ